MFKKIPRSFIKKGMVVISENIKNKNIWTFSADIHIINGHYTTIKMNYQPYLHINNVRQTAKIININKYISKNNLNENLSNLNLNNLNDITLKQV